MFDSESVLNAAMEMQGARGAALIDLETGTCTAVADREDKDGLSLAAAVQSRMLRAQIRLAREQMNEGGIEDLLITFDRSYHLIRPVRSDAELPSAFLYLIMDRSQANLAIARRRLAEFEAQVAQRITMDQRLQKALKGGGPDREERAQDGNSSELPPFMREESVMRLLGLSSSAKK